MKIILTETQYKKLIEDVENSESSLSAKELKVQEAKNNVQAIAKKINGYGLGADVTDFMVRVAGVETCYGLATGNVDIWQIDPIAFKDTKDTKSHPSLKKKIQKLKEYDIDWLKLSQTDMESSMTKNAIAARLVLSNIPSSIPSDLQGQATYWKNNYNTSAGAGTANDFIKKSTNLKACTAYVK
jgi:hypothetical protein